MGRPRIVPLSTILVLEEISPRGPKESGSKARQRAIESLKDAQYKALTSIAEQEATDTARGASLGSSIPALVVCRPPKDLPKTYREKVRDKQYVLVDGYQRYEAIRARFGLAIRVNIKEIKAETMADLMREALALNYSHPLPLTEGEKKAHVFRLLLLGALDGGIDRLTARFSDVFARSTLANYKNLAEFARIEAKLEGLPPDEVRDTLRAAVRTTFAGLDFISPRYDSKGFPTKGTLEAWRKILMGGDITPYVERAQREFARREEEAIALDESLGYYLQDKDPQARIHALTRQLAIAKRESEQAQKESVIESFGQDLGEAP